MRETDEIFAELKRRNVSENRDVKRARDADQQERRGSARPSLHRLEAGDSDITLRGFQQIMKRLKCTISDIFEARAKSVGA
jgi:DNA-binding Xre family transcriptional regulator